MNENFYYPKPIDTLINKLQDSGFEAYIVGGCVRDFIIGLTPHDYDITTNALPQDIMSVFADFVTIPTGLKHGTVTVIADDIPVEITTFRTDGSYIDNRRPENVFFTNSYKDDASRRDFTMNAIAYSKKDGIIDYFEGLSDIQNKIIRTVGDPDKRFSEDALRILRAIRFSSVLNFEIEENTKKSIHDNKDLLKNISSERIFSEFTKLLCGNNVKNILIEYSDIIGVFIPEIIPMIGFCQHNPHHIYDVWTHTAVAVENIPHKPTLRLAAFFHDIGKPSTFSVGPDNIGHFYSHSEKSMEIASTVLNRLKADNSTISRVKAIIKYHDLQIPEDKKLIKKHMSRLSPELFSDLIHMFRTDTLALAPEYASRMEHFDAIDSIKNEIIAEEACLSLKTLAIKGSDLIAIGILPGKQIGNILNILLEEVLSERLPNDKNALIQYVIDKKLT